MDNSTPKKRKDSTASAEPKTGPVRIIRVHDVSASIWPRSVTVQGVPQTLYSATFERSYQTKDGAYKYTRSFDPQTLPRLVEVIQQTAAALNDLRSS